MPPEELSAEKEAFRQLAGHLRNESLAETILQHLEALNEAFADQVRTQEGGALAFLEAEGLPTLLSLLKGTATSHTKTNAGSTIQTISESAGKALMSLLTCTVEYHEPFFTTDLTRAMISAFREAPHTMGRVAAARALAMVADGRPEARKAIAEASAIGAVLAFFYDLQESSWFVDEVVPVWELGHMLLRREKAARRDLKDAIGSQNHDLAFIAIFLCKDSVCVHGAKVMAAIKKCGLAKALVFALTHPSPCCAGAAAATLSMIGKTEGGYELLKDSGAIPALVSVIRTARPAADPKKMTRFSSGDSFKFFLDFRPQDTEGIPFSNPTAVAVAVMRALNLNGSLLDSFLESKGVAAVVQLLEKSTCPEVTSISETLIACMLDSRTNPHEPTWPPGELAEKYFQAGLWKVAVQVLKRQIKGTDRSLLYMLAMFFEHLPNKLQRQTMTPLVKGGLVEVTVAHMAEAGEDELVRALGLFKGFFRSPEGRKKMCAPGTVDQLMHWTARWLSEAPWRELLTLPMLLSDLLKSDACCAPAAIRANVIPGLIRCRDQARDDVDLDREEVKYVCSGLESALDCFKELMGPDTCQLWEAAIDEGLVPALINLLTLDDELTVSRILKRTGQLMMFAPSDQLCQWGPGLVQEIMEVLTTRAGDGENPPVATLDVADTWGKEHVLFPEPTARSGASPPIAARAAAETLCDISSSFLELFADVQTWGMEDSLQQLTRHSDADLAAAAGQLLQQLFDVEQEQPEVKQSASASSPSSNTAEDHRPRTLDPNQQGLPVPFPSPTAEGTPELTIKRPDRGDKDKLAAVKEADRGDKDKPAAVEEADEKQPPA